MINWPLNGPEDGGLGALIVALIWAFIEWWRKRTGTGDGNVARRS